MKIKFFKIKKNYKKENFEINLNIYWKILVVFFALTVVISFIFAYNLFRQINKEDVSTILNNNKIDNKEKEEIEDALEYFSEREKKSNEILSATSPVDPSL